MCFTPGASFMFVLQCGTVIAMFVLVAFIATCIFVSLCKRDVIPKTIALKYYKRFDIKGLFKK